MEQFEPPERRAAEVVGSGVIGLTVGLDLLQRGYGVTIHDRNVADGNPGANTSDVAIGQVLPFVIEGKEGYYAEVERTKRMFDVARQRYDELAQNPEVTGVMQVRNVEPVNTADDWPPYLAELMGAEKHSMETPLTITGTDGKEKSYDAYYEFDTWSINAPKTRRYLIEEFKRHGGEFKQGNLTAESLAELGELVVNCSGLGARELAPDPELHGAKGHTIVYRPETPLPPVAITVDDLALMPREDGTFIVGALYLDNDESPLPKEEEMKKIIAGLKQVISHPVGSFEGLDPSILDTGAVVHNVGHRAVKRSGMQILQDPKNGHVLHAYGFGGIGWSLGPGVPQEVRALTDKPD